MALGRTTPILRIFDEATSELHAGLARRLRAAPLEHHADGSRGVALRIETSDLDAAGIDEQPWGRDMSIRDPFGNRLTFAGS